MTDKEKFKNTQKIIFAADLESRIKSALIAAATEQYKDDKFQQGDDRFTLTNLGITVDIVDKSASLTVEDKAKPKYIIGATKEEYRVQIQVPCDISRDSIVKGFAQKGFVIQKKDIELDADVSAGTKDYDGGMGISYEDKNIPTNQYIIYLKKIKEAPSKVATR
jgi:hypothetical protein